MKDAQKDNNNLKVENKQRHQSMSMADMQMAEEYKKNTGKKLDREAFTPVELDLSCEK